MNLVLHVWRQNGPNQPGKLERYDARDISPDSSFLEMLDQVNDQLISEGKDPIHFDSDCREGICGMCSLTINGVPHGPERSTTVCQLHMRHFKDGEEIYIEPFKAKAFPVVKDLVVDRTAFDRIIQAGGYVSVNTGGAPDANSLPISKSDADTAMDFATCIGCGACVAACKNGAAMLFVGAKVAHLNMLPQGKVEHTARVRAMVEQMDKEGFGNCSNYTECEAVCPKDIPIDVIARLNRGYRISTLKKFFGK